MDAVKSLAQMPAHPSKGGVIQIAVIGDKAQNALAIFGNHMLRETDKFDVIIVDPFRIPLFQLFLAAWFLFVCLHQVHNPSALVGAFAPSKVDCQ